MKHAFYALETLLSAYALGALIYAGSENFERRVIKDALVWPYAAAFQVRAH